MLEGDPVVLVQIQAALPPVGENVEVDLIHFPLAPVLHQRPVRHDSAAADIQAAAAARRVTLIVIGLLQYIAPTLQFLIGVVVAGETLGTLELGGFVAVWCALAAYSVEGVVVARRTAGQK